jgi:hypothetical protein
MENPILLSQDDVLESGILFDGDDVHWGGDYGQQVCQWAKDGLEEPVTGLVYEIRNGGLDYYCHYENGIPNGPYVKFFEDGKVKRYANMNKGVLHGSVISWNLYGQISFRADYQFGVIVSCLEWDDDGKLIREQLEPDEEGKRKIERHEILERKWEQQDKNGTVM